MRFFSFLKQRTAKSKICNLIIILSNKWAIDCLQDLQAITKYHKAFKSYLECLVLPSKCLFSENCMTSFKADKWLIKSIYATISVKSHRPTPIGRSDNAIQHWDCDETFR